MKSAPDKPVTLVCTYRGSEGRPRSFDVLVDGEKIATQTLEIHPGELFDFEYPLPEQLTRGKERITVKFQSRPNAMAGSVFDVRVAQLDPSQYRRAPDRFNARLETSKGVILIEIHRDWAPNGVDRFYNLVRAGYYNDVRFHRVIKERWAQFGINGDPKVSNIWRARTIPDDPRRESNVRGTVAYAFAVANGRTTQVFINLRDNSAAHDAEPFVPFGLVIEGMDVADKLNAEYGESAGGGIRAGKQGPLFEGGNAYLERNFPRLDYIIRATVVER